MIRLLAVLLFIWTGNLRAEPLPPHAKKTLDEILAQDDYRNRHVVLGPFERLRQAEQELLLTVLHWLKEELSGIRDSCDTFVTPFLDRIFNWIGGILMVGANVVEVMFFIVLAAALSYIGWRLAKRFRRNLRAQSSVPALHETSGSIDTIEIAAALLNRGELSAAIAMVRRLLRRYLLSNEKIPLSVSDRDALRSIRAGDAQNLFAEASALFEIAVYAMREVERELVQALIERYRQWQAVQ